MVNYLDEELWKNWANKNIDVFKNLKTNSKIAIMLPETDDLIVLKKPNSNFTAHKDNRYNFEFPFAEIGFKFNKGAAEKVLQSKNFNTFVKLIQSEEIGLLSFVEENQLNEKGYKDFLKKIGFKIGCSCSCCC